MDLSMFRRLKLSVNAAEQAPGDVGEPSRLRLDGDVSNLRRVQQVLEARSGLNEVADERLVRRI